jgi:hypothetical protein
MTTSWSARLEQQHAGRHSDSNARKNVPPGNRSYCSLPAFAYLDLSATQVLVPDPSGAPLAWSKPEELL